MRSSVRAGIPPFGQGVKGNKNRSTLHGVGLQTFALAQHSVQWADAAKATELPLLCKCVALAAHVSIEHQAERECAVRSGSSNDSTPAVLHIAAAPSS
jgi:hypothetical protein